MSPQNQANTIYIGVDFGTTYSGVATVFSGKPKDVEIIKDWPGVTTTSEKCPTLILYNQPATTTSFGGTQKEWQMELYDPSPTKWAIGRNDFGTLKDIKWGYQIRCPKERPLSCIKLFLDERQKLPSWVKDSTTRATLHQNDRLPKDAVADYLAKVQDHIKTNLMTRYGAAMLSDIKFQYVLTVPAVWSDVAKDATVTAAKHAGMGPNMTVISEPEAAAYFVLRSGESTQFKTGDHIVVTDAGGGTVDLISYQVMSVNPHTLSECAVGTGDVCGAVNINMRFEDHVRGRMGHEKFEKLKTGKDKTWQQAMKYFEDEPKRLIESGKDEDFEVPLPGVPDDDSIGISDSFMTLTSAQVRDIFEPIIQDVLKLIEGQVSTIHDNGHKVSAIILVGGFSKYLFDRVKAKFRTTTDLKSVIIPKRKLDDRECASYSPILVIQPAQAWTAIAQGAAPRGLDGDLIEDRKCRYNYGVEYSLPYNPQVHLPRDAYYSETHEQYQAKHCMTWYVKRASVVSEKKVIAIPFHRHFETSEFPSTHALATSRVLYYNTDDVAPTSKRPGTMHPVCKLYTDLSSVPRELFELKATSTGIRYWELCYDLNMSIESATINFFLTIEGKRYGSVTAQFEG